MYVSLSVPLQTMTDIPTSLMNILIKSDWFIAGFIFNILAIKLLLSKCRYYVVYFVCLCLIRTTVSPDNSQNQLCK